MANENQSQTLDETLNKTELGHVINERKNAIMIVGALIVAAIVAFSIYRYFQKKEEAANLNQAYAFQSSVVDPFLDGEMDASQAVQKLKNIDPRLTGNPDLAPAVFEAVAKLTEENKVEESIEILSSWHEKFDRDSYLRYFSGLRLAPLLENSGKQKEAIGVYEGLIKGSRDILESKLYLELGRLYTEEGQNDQAKSFFEHIIKNHETTEEAKFARLYLQRIKGQAGRP